MKEVRTDLGPLILGPQMSSSRTALQFQFETLPVHMLLPKACLVLNQRRYCVCFLCQLMVGYKQWKICHNL